MLRQTEERSLETARRTSIRCKILQALGAVLITVGLFVDWAPSQAADIPDTWSFLVILGGLIGSAGLLAAFRRE